YLLSVQPLLNDENYRRVEGLAKEFEEGIAVKLQRYLVLKSWWSSNYVSDWWEEYVYLRGRSPLMVNSNFYGTDTLLRPTRLQAARAATIIHYCLCFRRLIERQELEPVSPITSLTSYLSIYIKEKVCRWSSNYVSDWWEEYVYLRGRSPLMVNSNFYGTDTLLRPTRLQAARAATIIHYCLCFRRLIERQELEPVSPITSLTSYLSIYIKEKVCRYVPYRLRNGWTDFNETLREFPD
ncbi:jg2833, partial [Pararge aegeria aegeria]